MQSMLFKRSLQPHYVINIF